MDQRQGSAWKLCRLARDEVSQAIGSRAALSASGARIRSIEGLQVLRLALERSASLMREAEPAARHPTVGGVAACCPLILRDRRRILFGVITTCSQFTHVSEVSVELT